MEPCFSQKFLLLNRQKPSVFSHCRLSCKRGYLSLAKREISSRDRKLRRLELQRGYDIGGGEERVKLFNYDFSSGFYFYFYLFRFICLEIQSENKPSLPVLSPKKKSDKNEKYFDTVQNSNIQCFSGGGAEGVVCRSFGESLLFWVKIQAVGKIRK